MEIALVTLGLVVLAAVPRVYLSLYGMAEVRALVSQEVDLSRVADGVYTGSYRKGHSAYDVEVVVHDHRIVSVKSLEARTNPGRDWNDRATALILEKRAIKLDVISGASVHTQAFEKAVDVALSTPQPQ
jgi:uncharacterized protein with FMN-binding domain